MDPITISLSPQLAALLLVVALTALIFGLLILMERQGAVALPARWLLPLVQALSAVMFVFAIVAAVSALWDVIYPRQPPLAAQATPGLGFGAGTVIVALLSAPFLIWRSIVAQRTVDLAAETLLNDKLNAAATDLAAHRQVTRSVEQEGKEVILTEWQDDLVTRAAAIDRLEGLANEHPEIAPRIANLLSVYLRELSAEYPAKDRPKEADAEEIRAWARTVKSTRSDKEKAAQTLGRLRDIVGVDLARLRLDLRRANLQGFGLRELNFEKADLSEARLEGADLSLVRLAGTNLPGARLEGADLLGARLEGANLSAARLEGANLSEARLEGADLRWARLQGANLSEARLEGADLSSARLEAANLIEARLEGARLSWTRLQGADLRAARLEGAKLIEAQLGENTSLSAATLRGAALREVNLSNARIKQAQVNETFGDGSVTLPNGFTRPDHWPPRTLEFNEFLTEWRQWQADPAAYTPPD